MSAEFWALFIVASTFVVLASWLALVAQQPSKPEPPTLDTRGPDDR